MGQTTVSERLFSQLCTRSGVACRRIGTGPGPTPDFAITLAGIEVVCEVKQIDPNEEDLRELAELRATGSAGRRVPNRLRGKLKDISPQLKAAATGGSPTLLVVYDNTPFKVYSDHTDAVEAMLGRETVTLVVPERPNQQVQVAAHFFGGDRGVGPGRNTSVSAVAILEGGPEMAIGLRVYHNPYARIRLEPTLLSALPVSQPLLPDATTVRL